ncbi:MAG: phosphatidate cytidylyltransferase [Pseudomonadota bacterium]
MSDQPAAAPKWADLRQRVLSAFAMLVIGVLAVWAGGIWFHLAISLICGLMVWELARMVDSTSGAKASWIGMASGIGLFIASYSPAPGFVLPLLFAPGFVGVGQLTQNRTTFMLYATAILIAGFGFMALRDEFGTLWMCWLLIVVVVVDVAGYFAGRMIGGPKFWPRVSPKKTWSGTIAGWVGAAIVGLVFMAVTGGGTNIIGVSVSCAMAAQMGDIAESAIKRRVGVKDSSNLIPGHGGVLDRFDGMLGASLLLLLTQQFTAFPPS